MSFHGQFVILFDLFRPLSLEHLTRFLGLVIASPAYLILLVFRYESYPLQNIGDIIYPPLLHSEFVHRVIQVHTLLGSIFDKLDKLLGELNQTILLSEALAKVAAAMAANAVRRIEVVLVEVFVETPSSSACSIITRVLVLLIRLVVLLVFSLSLFSTEHFLIRAWHLRLHRAGFIEVELFLSSPTSLPCSNHLPICNRTKNNKFNPKLQ